MNLHIISTGSKGNCYILSDDQGRAIALDAGVSIKAIMAALHHDIEKFDGALITHEHQDHCKAVQSLHSLGVSTYMSEGTAIPLIEAETHYGDSFLPLFPILPMTSDGRFDVFKVGSWYVQPFSVQHDAADPVGFLLANAIGYRILYATDTFYIRYKFERLTHIIIECNYCKETLMHNIATGAISESRQKRLLHSHFSLENVLKFLKATDLTHCVKIVLVHLSDGNSDEKMMVNAVEKQTGIETIAAADGMDINFDLFPF